MTDQKLVDELEKALRDEAYDGGMGALGPEEFTEYVRTLAETAADVVDELRVPRSSEKLSAEAADAILWSSRGMDEPGVDWPADRADAERIVAAVLAVFEKAHTPTDDERGWAEYRDAAPGNNTPEQRRAFFAALGRSEVPEPSRPHCDGCAKYAHHHCYHCGKRADLPHPTWCPNFTESAPEPQGEPSDAQALENFLGKLAGDGAYTLDFTSAASLHGHIVSLLRRDIATLRAAGGVR